MFGCTLFETQCTNVAEVNNNEPTQLYSEVVVNLREQLTPDMIVPTRKRNKLFCSTRTSPQNLPIAKTTGSSLQNWTVWKFVLYCHGTDMYCPELGNCPEFKQLYKTRRARNMAVIIPGDAVFLKRNRYGKHAVVQLNDDKITFIAGSFIASLHCLQNLLQL